MKHMIIKSNSVTEIQVSNLDTSTEIEDNDSLVWRGLSEMPSMSEGIDTCDIDETEWLDDTFYQHAHTVSNLEYAK